MSEERKIHITINSDKTVLFGVSKNGTQGEVVLNGCYQAEVYRGYKQLYEISSTQLQEAKEQGKENEIPEEYRPHSPESLGKTLLLTFCQDMFLMRDPMLNAIVKIPDVTVKSLDDLLGRFDLDGKKIGKTYTCYSEHLYSIPLPEGVEVLIR